MPDARSPHSVQLAARQIRDAIESTLNLHANLDIAEGNLALDEALYALDGLEEQFEVERVALRIACRDLQDWHADFRDNRAKDYEPPDDGDVEQLMADLRRKAVWTQEELDADRDEARERAERFGWTGSNPASEPESL